MFRDNPAFLSVLEPGDRIVATMRATERSRLVAARLGSLALGVAWVLAVVLTHENLVVALPLVVVTAALNLALWSRQHSYFIAVTERLFICHGVTWFRGRPTRLAFTAPLPEVSLTVGGSTAFLGTSVSYKGPGVPAQGLTLIVGSRSEEFVGLVLTALRAGGASVAQ
jgi:hypothetical protein